LAENQKLENAAQVVQLRRQLNSLPPGSAERAAIDQQMVQLDDKNRQLTATQGQLTTQISSLSISSANATQQATKSSTGVPNTSVVPPPASAASTPETPQQVTIQPSEQVAAVSGTTVSGPPTQESVFDPRQDVGENVFDPDSAVPRADITDAAARINDPYYGLTPAQLKALGGADPTDPYIRARLGIPQLSGSTLNPGGFAAFKPTGVPLIDGAISAISSFASSLSSFFGPPTKPTVTQQGTTTGAQAAVGTPVNVANAQTARDQPVNPASDPSQFPAYDDDGNLKDGFAVNNETGETYFQGYPGNVNNASESVFDPRQDVGENVFDPVQTYNGPATEESVFDPRQDVGENVFDPGQTYNGPATEESVFDPRQDVGENVFDPGTTYGGPATEESVFDPRQDVGENVFDPDSAVPRSELADAAVGVNDPYYGLSPAQLEALGGADPTDPYIRARLGIPQLPDSTLNPSGFATFAPTGVPLIDNAVGAISSFTSSLSNLFTPTTKPTVTQQGTTTGAPPPAVIDTKAVAADAAAVKQQNPTLAAAAKENLANIEAANANVVGAEENIAINNQSIQANEQAQAQALEQQRNAEAIIAQNNAELADDNLPDDRRAELEANNAAQRASIAQNAAVIDEAQTNIDQSTANNEQQANSILDNQYVVAENAEAFQINTTGGVDENGNPVNNTANDPEFNDYGAPEYNAETDGPLTDPGTQELTEEETAALFDEAEATVEAPPVAAPGEPGGAPLLTDAELATIYGTTDPQEVGAIQGTSIITDEARAALSDPETIKAQEALNQEAAENPAIIPSVVTEDDPAATIPEGDELGPPTEDEAVDAAEDPEIAAADAAANAELVADPEATIPEDVDPADDPEIPEATLEEDPEATIPEDVDPDVDAELQEPPGTEEPFTDLAEPVDEETDPELLAGPEEEEPYTDLAEPVDPDADPELEELGDPELQDGEITDLAEPVDPDADPELEQLGGPPEDEELVQLSGPTDVDPDSDAAFGTPDGQEESETPSATGLREPTEADVAAAEQAAAKQNTINQATLQSRYKQPGNSDWRVRLNLAPTSDYLYNAGGNNAQAAGILAPLRATNGVVFPYTPTITTSYQANYEQYDLIHSNYRGIYYKNSRVNDVSIRAMFTAQDTSEANYLLAVIHFFRSVTKMFYGQDANRGVPPPLVFLNGFGNFQFSNHPCVVGQFNYTLPSDVDYIRATSFNNYGGNLFNRRQPIAVAPGGVQFAGAIRLANALLPKNAQPQTPTQNALTGSVTNTDLSTYVPTKIEIDLTLIPVQTRDQVSNQFSLKEFANGNLIKKGFW
jgi:hypothetical protein